MGCVQVGNPTQVSHPWNMWVGKPNPSVKGGNIKAHNICGWCRRGRGVSVGVTDVGDVSVGGGEREFVTT